MKAAFSTDERREEPAPARRGNTTVSAPKTVQPFSFDDDFEEVLDLSEAPGGTNAKGFAPAALRRLISTALI